MNTEPTDSEIEELLMREQRRQQRFGFRGSEQRYRLDGYPLCPMCRKDGLISDAATNALHDYAAKHQIGKPFKEPDLGKCFKQRFSCPDCFWEGRIKPKMQTEEEKP